MTRELLSVERQQRSRARRAGLYGQLEKAIKKHYYEGEADASKILQSREIQKGKIEDKMESFSITKYDQ